MAVLPKFIADRFGTDGLKKWTDALSPQAREVYTGEILVSGWYPLREAYLEPTELMCRLFFAGDPRGAWESGRYSADYALKGVYKAFVKLASVKSFISRASAVMSTYYTPGSMAVHETGGKRAVLRMTDFPEDSQLVEQRIAGWIQRSLEIHGCHNVRVDIAQSLTRQAPYTELVLTWD